MKPVGIFLNFTRLYEYVHWMFFHFFFRSWWNTGQKYRFSSIMELLCIFGHLDGLKTLDILVSGFCFYSVHRLEFNFNRTDFLLLLHVLCSNVEWNPFLMKTTFTSDLSWFESTFGYLSSVLILLFTGLLLYCIMFKPKTSRLLF